MSVRAVTPLVQPHGLVVIDAGSDHENFDRARDEIAVPDAYETEWEPPYRHGPITDVSAASSADTPVSSFMDSAAGGKGTAGARPATSPPKSGGSGSRTTEVSAPAVQGQGA